MFKRNVLNMDIKESDISIKNTSCEHARRRRGRGCFMRAITKYAANEPELEARLDFDWFYALPGSSEYFWFPRVCTITGGDALVASLSL